MNDDNKVMRSWRIRSDLVQQLEKTSRETGMSQTRLVEDALEHLFAEPWLKEVAERRSGFRLREVALKKMRQRRGKHPQSDDATPPTV